MADKTGVIYILTNPSFPTYVKIGYADDINTRLKELNRSECIPFAFRVYATYEVEKRLQDKTLHTMIDTLNPTLRTIETFDGKQRVREFYAMSPENAYSILEAIAEIHGTTGKLKKWKLTQSDEDAEKTAEEIDTEVSERASNFSFEKCKIPVGAKIAFCFDQTITDKVVDDRHIEYGGKITSLTALAKTLLGKTNGIAGPLYFTYNGKILNDLRHELEVV